MRRSAAISRRKTDAPIRSGLSWLTTFNDMTTLLMVFFVLLFAMGSMDVKRFKHFQNALQSAMGVLNEGQNAPVGLIEDRDNPPEPGKRSETASQSAENRRPGDAQGVDLSGTEGIEADYTPKGIQLILEDTLLFRSGSARLTQTGRRMLDKVADIIRPMERSIIVEGHTDNVPIQTVRYPSNWELSLARAVQVVKYFIRQGGISPERLSAAGYGDAKPRVANDTAADRARNRRVEIILGENRES